MSRLIDASITESMDELENCKNKVVLIHGKTSLVKKIIKELNHIPVIYLTQNKIIYDSDKYDYTKNLTEINSLIKNEELYNKIIVIEDEDIMELCKSQDFNNLIINHRFFNLTIIITVQNLKYAPKYIRYNCDYIFETKYRANTF